VVAYNVFSWMIGMCGCYWNVNVHVDLQENVIVDIVWNVAWVLGVECLNPG